MAYDPSVDGPDPNAGNAPGNWWEGPPPPGYTGQWPPPVPPGGKYGPNFGQIIYAPGTPGGPAPGPDPGWGNTPPPAPTPTPTPTPAPNPGTPPPAAAGDYDFATARGKIEAAIGRPLTDADVASAFSLFGGNANSRFTDAGLAPVIAHFKGAGSGTPPPSGGGGNRAPTFTAPGYTPPAAASAPAPFSYADFSAPDPNDLQNDPWTKYTLKSEQDQIQKGAAAKGILNTGGTINDLLVNAADVNSQGYQNIWNRKRAEYDTNRGNAFENYKTNYGISADVRDSNYQTQYKDPFQFGYQGALDAFNSKIHNFDQGQYYDTHNKDQQVATNTHNTDMNRQYDWYKTLFTYQQGEDEWARKFKLLGLI